MNVLAFDTCFAACSVAVATPARTVAICEPMAKGHAEALMPMIATVMANAGLKFRDLDLIAITNGPGTFTGTRVAVSAGKALSSAANISIGARSSLEVMALGARRLLGAKIEGRHIAVAVDARRDQVYLQVMRPDGIMLAAPVVVDAVAAARQIKGIDVIAVGSGAAMLANAAAARAHVIATALPDLLPDARDLAGHAPVPNHRQFIKPLYLRAPDAKPQSGKAVARIS